MDYTLKDFSSPNIVAVSRDKTIYTVFAPLILEEVPLPLLLYLDLRFSVLDAVSTLTQFVCSRM